MIAEQREEQAAPYKLWEPRATKLELKTMPFLAERLTGWVKQATLGARWDFRARLP
jgi:hypothetical protein